MNEEIDFILESTKEAMQGSLNHLEKSLLNIRAGTSSPQMLGLLWFTDSLEPSGQCEYSRFSYYQYTTLGKKYAFYYREGYYGCQFGL